MVDQQRLQPSSCQVLTHPSMNFQASSSSPYNKVENCWACQERQRAWLALTSMDHFAVKNWLEFVEAQTYFTTIKYACVFATTYLISSFIWHCVWTPFKLYGLAQIYGRVRLDRQGKWAVVTGASQGIGESLKVWLSYCYLNRPVSELRISYTDYCICVTQKCVD